MRRKLPPQLALIGITDREVCGGIDGLLDRTELLLRAGLQTVMLREKDLSGAALFDLASRLREETRRYGALLLINDRVDVAMAVGADGVHLGYTGIPAASVRSFLPPDMLLGVSAHNRSELEAAERAGADYATLSPMFATESKPGVSSLGYRGLSEAIAGLSIPVIALGGINKANSVRAMAAGAFGVAAIRSLFDPKIPIQDLEDFIA